MKITFTMHEPDEKKHSVRFNLEKVERVEDQDGKEYATPPFSLSAFRPSFYIPAPFAAKAKRIRVTIEEL
jgi:hypothetical protein